jgi:hypothetical protein
MGGTNTAGVRVERRALLLLGMGAPLLLRAGETVAAAPPGQVPFDTFLNEARRDLRPLLPAADPVEQDAYVYRAAALLRRLKDIPDQPFVEARKIDIRPLGRPLVFAVTALRGKPGAVLPPHNHPNYSVATMGLAGAVRVRNFEPDSVLPPYSSKERFRLLQTSERWLRPHDVVTLTAMRDNIHTFEAGPEGALWLDISTPHANSDGSDFSYLRLVQGAAARVGDVYEAIWGLKD